MPLTPTLSCCTLAPPLPYLGLAPALVLASSLHISPNRNPELNPNPNLVALHVGPEASYLAPLLLCALWGTIASLGLQSEFALWLGLRNQALFRSLSSAFLKGRRVRVRVKVSYSFFNFGLGLG